MIKTLISDLCRPAKTVDTDTTIENILYDIDWNSIPCVVVIDNDKNVIGIISEQDMIYAESIGIKKSDLKAWEICSKKLIKIAPEDTLRGATQLMVDNKVNHVLVMTGDYLEGVISSFDVLKEVIKN
ncbi:MAG: CBS domain-containing protein [Proteobacteria bacterium]|nr:CBS domain-containing protein [Pseudomonadota bacterium]NOG59346.1 CBS domain-containing protein [Pseudomonadota bacterium]